MATTNLTREECANRATLIDVSNYGIHLDLLDVRDSDTFLSTTTVTFSAEVGSSSWIDLIAPTIVSATLNGEELPATDFDGTRLSLHNLAADNTLVVVAHCEYSRTGEGLHKFTDPADNEIYLYSQFEIADARRVYACFDQPDMKAVFTFTIDAPSAWKVFSNTFAETEELTGGTRHRFATTKKMSTYITAVIAGAYEGATDEYVGPHGTYPLGLYCRRSMREFLDVEDFMLITKQGFEFFEREFSVAYPFGKYDQIVVPEFNAGAMENAGCVTFYEGTIYRSRATDNQRQWRANTILHEMAHMWFGNLVTMKWWEDLWLNESFAEWSSYYANNLATRFTESWTSFLVDRKLWGYREDQASGTHAIATDMADLDAVEVNFDGIAYAKGASTLRQLVAFVGEKEFLAGISQYFKKYAWGNTELKDLLAELEEVSGRDLSAFTATWIQTEGVNLLRPDITLAADGTYASVRVRQEPPTEPAGVSQQLRKHRIAVGLYSLNGNAMECTQRIELDVDGPVTNIPQLAGVKQPDLLLLNDLDYTYAKIRLDERSLKTAVNHLADIDDSLNRALIWTALWDMTRDAEMRSRDFLDVVVSSGKREPQVAITSRLFGQARSAASFYARPANRPAYMQSLATAFLEWAHSLEVGSDTQFSAARQFVACASSQEHLEILRGLLNGSYSINGVTVDKDFRWAIVIRLASRGWLGLEEIAEEEQRDQTKDGRNSAVVARAAIPTAEAKQAAWDAIFSNELSNEELESTIGGWQTLDNADLLAPYVDRYFAALPRVWADLSNESAQKITEGLFPMMQLHEETIQKANDFLEIADIPHGCRRLVSEGRDAVARSLRGQAIDI